VEIEIPYTPRDVFKPFHERSERFACIVAHRRAGKTVAAINDLIRDTITCPLKNPRTAYIAPFYKQAKAVAWDYAKEFTAPMRDVGLVVNESELRIDFPNGGRMRLFGADSYDSMRGLYFDSVVLDEPADFPVNAWPTVIRPALSDREGKATFIGTPKGRNEFYEIYKASLTNDRWFSALIKASETDILEPDELSEALKTMGEDRYNQEFEVSFDAAIAGAYWATEMQAVMAEGRIAEVPYEKSKPVYTAWDLGVGDSTAIWFAQFVGAERRIIDYYEASGVGLDFYVKMLNDKGYVYERHIFPHDIRVRELGSGKSRLETLAELGLRNYTVAPNLRVDDGIQAVRSFLSTCWFDEKKTDRGVEALKQYRRSYDERQRTWRARPEHDWTSHASDAFRYLSITNVVSDSWSGGGSIKRNIQGVA
jgi:hypothetical protein